MSVKITYFVHGTTIDNEENKKTGWDDGELSEIGIQQAKDLGITIADLKFDEVFSSDLQRAVDSAHLMFGDKYYIHKDKRLRECDYGSLTKAAEYWKLTEYINKPYPSGTKYNGESYKDVEKRIRNFCEFLISDYNGKHIAVISHQAPQLALEVIVNHKTWEQAISEDWRINKNWKPGWEYILN